MNKQFQEWFYSISKYSDMIYSDGERGEYRTNIQYVWDSLPFSCQWGVYLEFFDSKKIDVTVFYHEITGRYKTLVSFLPDKMSCFSCFFDTRQEAQQEAIKKAFELL